MVQNIKTIQRKYDFSTTFASKRIMNQSNDIEWCVCVFLSYENNWTDIAML